MEEERGGSCVTSRPPSSPSLTLILPLSRRSLLRLSFAAEGSEAAEASWVRVVPQEKGVGIATASLSLEPSPSALPSPASHTRCRTGHMPLSLSLSLSLSPTLSSCLTTASALRRAGADPSLFHARSLQPCFVCSLFGRRVCALRHSSTHALARPVSRRFPDRATLPRGRTRAVPCRLFPSLFSAHTQKHHNQKDSIAAVCFFFCVRVCLCVSLCPCLCSVQGPPAPASTSCRVPPRHRNTAAYFLLFFHNARIHSMTLYSTVCTREVDQWVRLSVHVYSCECTRLVASQKSETAPHAPPRRPVAACALACRHKYTPRARIRRLKGSALCTRQAATCVSHHRDASSATSPLPMSRGAPS